MAVLEEEGGESWYHFFSPCLCNVYPCNVHATASMCMLFLLHYNKSFALLLSNFMSLELGQYPCMVSTSGQPIGVPNMIFICLLHLSLCVLSKFSTHLSVLYMVSKSILLPDGHVPPSLAEVLVSNLNILNNFQLGFVRGWLNSHIPLGPF